MKYLSSIFVLLLSGLLLFACSEDDSDGIDDPDEIDYENYHLQPVGESANDLLSAENFDKVHVEIVHVEDFEPSEESIESVEAFLAERLNKPNGIESSLHSIPSPGLAPYSVEDLEQVESNNKSVFTNEDQLAVFAFFADGSYSENENVLGIAYRNTSVALFEEKIQELSGGIGEPSTSMVESTVAQHEFGHIMGLVNIGTPTQTDHQDEENGHHCDVEDCLMYYTADTGDIISNLIGMSDVPDLDDQCIADLQANGGK